MKNKVFLVGMFGIMLVFGIMIIGCKEAESKHEPEPKTQNIKYQVTSTYPGRRVDIQYQKKLFENVYLEKVTLPWEVTFSAPLYSATLNVLSASLGSGSITAKIFVDGMEVRSQTRTDGLQIIIWYNF